jgi:glutathione S-transferase
VGDRLTLSDLAFAVAAAPVVLPPNYGGSIPSFEQLPSEIQAIVKEMRPSRRRIRIANLPAAAR